MPKQTKKSRNAPPTPKRGKARAVLKKPSSKKSEEYWSIPYVRHGQKSGKSRPERTRWGRSVKDYLNATDKSIISLLMKDSLLKPWFDRLCPHCASGKLGKLSYNASRKVWVHRCRAKKCQKFVQPHDFHPVFYNGPRNRLKLQQQSAILHCAIAGVEKTAAHLILDVDHKPVERVYSRLEDARRRYVMMVQPSIKYCKDFEWNDVEADEADIGKGDDADAPAATPVKWLQIGGVVERGHPHTLYLRRLKPKRTQRRAPGPGPIRKKDWVPFAKKFLQGRRVVLHSDGARTYKLKMRGVVHDNVIHKKKQVVIKGKTVWVKPRYVRLHTHTLPDGSTLKVKAGTQVIDRFWQSLRKYLGHSPRHPDNLFLERKIRSAQWLYWNKGKNLMIETGNMIGKLLA